MCGRNWTRHFPDWRLWIRPLLILIYGIFVVIVAPALIANSLKDGFTRRDQLILVAGLLVLAALPIAVWNIVQHAIHYTKPNLQKHIIRILWMVPIYALNAWAGLWFPQHSIYMDLIREIYEAYVIHNFMTYLQNYLNMHSDLEAALEFKPQIKHKFPLCCLRPWPMGREFIHNCRHGILQYTVVRPITAIISAICEYYGVYGEGIFSPQVAFVYIVVINNISQFVAMYCLILFYYANKEELMPMRPFAKFACIKAVVFFSFIQGCLINFLVYINVIKGLLTVESGTSHVEVASLWQNFLICIEMFIAAVAHTYVFPHTPFHVSTSNSSNHSWWRAFLSMMDISDMQEDVTEHFSVVSSSITRRFNGRSLYQPLSRSISRTPSERKYLINKRDDDAHVNQAETTSTAGDSSAQLTGITPDTPTTAACSSNAELTYDFAGLQLPVPHANTVAITAPTTSEQQNLICIADFDDECLLHSRNVPSLNPHIVSGLGR